MHDKIMTALAWFLQCTFLILIGVLLGGCADKVFVGTLAWVVIVSFFAFIAFGLGAYSYKKQHGNAEKDKS